MKPSPGCGTVSGILLKYWRVLAETWEQVTVGLFCHMAEVKLEYWKKIVLFFVSVMIHMEKADL